LIAAVPERLAWMEATSTSPLAVVEGRGIVTAEPVTLAVTTAPPDGRALSARPDPETMIPSSSASARNGRWRHRAILGRRGRRSASIVRLALKTDCIVMLLHSGANWRRHDAFTGCTESRVADVTPPPTRLKLCL